MPTLNRYTPCASSSSWARYEDLLSNATGTSVIGRKEFRDGLGAVVKKNGTGASATINLTGSRVDDNGVLRISGGVLESDWDLQTQDDFFEFVQGLWSQTHLKEVSSSATEPAINNQSTNNGANSTATWGFTTITYSGGPGDDYFFEYPYTVNTTTSELTVSGLPSFQRYDARDWPEQIRFTTKNSAALPTTTPALSTTTDYYLDEYWSTPGTFEVKSLPSTTIDFSGVGSLTADQMWIKTPWGLPVYIEEVSGEVTFETFSFRMHIRGDSDMASVCEVRYRRSGQTAWKRAADARPYRANAKTCNDTEYYEDYNWHISGCIMRLAPNVEYDVQFTILNSSGVYLGGSQQGDGESATITSTFRTRMRPVRPSGNVYQPTTTDELRQLLGCTGAGTSSFNPAQPGDIIELPQSDLSDQSGTNFLSGVSIAGTEDSPILVQGHGPSSVIPRITMSSNVDWVTFADCQIRNWSSNLNSSSSRFAVKCSEDSRGVVFSSVEIKNPDLPAGVHAQAALGKRYDGHSGFYLGGNENEDHRWWSIEDCHIELGKYPEFDSSTYTAQDVNQSLAGTNWLPGEGFDARTRSSVFQFCRFQNLYETGYGHTSCSGEDNISRHNEMGFCEFYSIYDDLWELDHSQGGHIHHHCRSNHGANWNDLSINGLTPKPHQVNWSGRVREYGKWTLGPASTYEGHDGWQLYLYDTGSSASPIPTYPISYISSSHFIRQRKYLAYTISGGDTFTCPGHSLANGSRVTFAGSQGASVPSQLTAESYNVNSNNVTSDSLPVPTTLYYVVNHNSSTGTFQVSATSGGAAITGITDPGAGGRYLADVDLWLTWAVRNSVSISDPNTGSTTSGLSFIVTDRLSDSYPSVDELAVAGPPDDDFTMMYSKTIYSSFVGYKILSTQDVDTGSIPNWFVNNQHTGSPNQGSWDSGLKWRRSWVPCNMVGSIIHTAAVNENCYRVAKQSAYWANNIWVLDEGSYKGKNTDDLWSSPVRDVRSSTAADTFDPNNPGSTGHVRHLYWDRNAWHNDDTNWQGSRLVGGVNLQSMYTNYGIDQNGLELTVPSGGDRLSDDLDNIWPMAIPSTVKPEIGFWAPSDFGTNKPLRAKDTSDLYDHGVKENDMPGIDNLSGPYLDNADTGNLSFMATKADDRRDIGAFQRGLGDTPTGTRSFVDFLTYHLPDGWTVQSAGTTYPSLGVNSGTGTERLIVSNAAGTAAILVEHEDRD